MIEIDFNIQHLFKLLDDESPEIQKILRQGILDNSLEIVTKRSNYYRQVDSTAQAIFIEILNDLHFDLVLQSFKQLMEQNLEDVDLEKAVMVLAYWNNPEVNIPTISRRLDEISRNIGGDLPHSGHPLSFIDHISQKLFIQYRFRGNTTDYYNPDNSFIDRVLETRRGIPITLSVLYMLIARRLDVPIIGVPMPAHFIVKFDNDSDEIFFDPFYGGKIYNRQEFITYLKQTRIKETEEIIRGCPDYQIIIRILRNIQLVYSSYRDEPEKVIEVKQLISKMENHYL